MSTNKKEKQKRPKAPKRKIFEEEEFKSLGDDLEKQKKKKASGPPPTAEKGPKEEEKGKEPPTEKEESTKGAEEGSEKTEEGPKVPKKFRKKSPDKTVHLFGQNHTGVKMLLVSSDIGINQYVNELVEKDLKRKGILDKSGNLKFGGAAE